MSVVLNAVDGEARNYVLKFGEWSTSEVGVLIDDRQAIILHKWSSGDPRHIELPERWTAALRDSAQKLALHHNHPSCSPLSPADLKVLFAFDGQSRIVAHGHVGTRYEAIKRRSCHQAVIWNASTMHIGWHLVKAHRVSTFEASLVWMHLVCIALQRAGFISYRAKCGRDVKIVMRLRETFVAEFVEFMSGKILGMQADMDDLRRGHTKSVSSGDYLGDP